MADNTDTPDEPAATESPYQLTDSAAAAADTYHRAGYPDAAVAGILAGQNYESGGFNPSAVNPSSKAFGRAQWLGSRKTELLQTASNTGVQPTNPSLQDHFTLGELQGNNSGGVYKPVGDYLHGATDAGEAGANYIHSFEGPGAAAEKTEIPAVARTAQQVLPAIQQRYAHEQQQLNDAYSQLDKAMGPTGQGKFDAQPLPPTQRSPQSTSLDDAYSTLDNAMQQDAQKRPPQQPGQPPQPTGYDWGTVGSALAEIPRGLLRGWVVDKLGLPADIGNWVSQYYQTHPHDAEYIGTVGADGGFGLSAQDYIDKKIGNDPLPAYDPNSGGYRLPLGSQDISKAIKYATGYDTNIQDTSIGGETLGHMAEFVGAGFAPGQLLKDAAGVAAATGEGTAAWAASKTKSIAGLLFHHVFAPAGVSGGLDAGEWAVDKATGDQQIGKAVGIAARAVLGGAAIASLGKGARVAQSYVREAPRNALDQALGTTPGTDVAAAKETALKNLENYQEPVSGYQTPPPLRTGSTPLQQFFRNLMTNEGQVKNDFITNIAPRNVTAMEGMRPEGEAEDAVTAIRNTQAARQSMINTRLQQAQDAADQAERIATRSSSGAPMVAGGGAGQTSAFDRGNAIVKEVSGARDDTAQHVNDQWDVAREQGLTTTPIEPAPMYSGLEGLIGENIRLQRGANFPYDIVNSLYEDGNPKGMFSKLGARDPSTIGQNQLYGAGTTIEQARGVDSQLGNAIRMEQDRISAPGNGGNPTLLRNMYRVQNVVKQAIDDAAVAGGNQEALRSALDATAQYHQTFDHGLIARILNEQGGATNAPKILHDFLGNSSNAIQAADMLKSVMAQRTGAAAARMNVGVNGAPGPAGAMPQQQFSQAWADWLRQDYLNFRADSKTAAAGSRQWLVNHAGFFDRMSGNPDFDQLHQELMGYSHVTDDLLPQVQKAAKLDQATIDHSVAQHFLGGDAGPRLDAVFKSPNPGAAMKELINDALQDGTGKGFKGLQVMVFNRVIHEAETGDPLRPDQTYYSFKKAQKFLDNPAVSKAFDVLRQADPQVQGNLDRLVQTLALEDRSRLDTGLQLPKLGTTPGGGGSGLGRSLATKIGQYASVHFIGRNLPAAGIQGPGLVSEYTRELMQHLPSNLQTGLGGLDPRTSVLTALREATLYDPEKFRALLAPVTGPSGQKWAKGIEPWLQSVGVMLPQPWLNPQGQGNEPSP